MSESCPYARLTANSATPVVIAGAGQGTLITVNVNSKGAAGNICTIYDDITNTSGHEMAIIDTTVPTAGLVYDAAFTRGLCAVLNGGATAADITVTFK